MPEEIKDQAHKLLRREYSNCKMVDRRGTMSARAENVNTPSELLTENENREVFDIIGKRCFVSKQETRDDDIFICFFVEVNCCITGKSNVNRQLSVLDLV